VLIAGQAVLFGSGGTCLPDNIFADTAGEIVSGLIIAGVNMIATPGGFQI